MRTKLPLLLAAAFTFVSTAAWAGKSLYCDRNGLAFLVRVDANGVVDYAKIGGCTSGPWNVTLNVIAASDTATAETDLTADANAGRAATILRRLRANSIHWGRLSKDQGETFTGQPAGGTLTIRADRLSDYVAGQMGPSAAQ